MGSAFGMLTVSIGALGYIMASKTRVKAFSNLIIFIALIISYACTAFISIYNVKNEVIYAKDKED